MNTAGEIAFEKADILSNLPLIEDYTISKDRQCLEAKLTLDPSIHHFLLDHKFIYAPGVKEDVDCLPVLPFSFGLELLAEAAAPLAPGYGLTGFKDVTAKSWIQLNGESRLNLSVKANFASTQNGSVNELQIKCEIYTKNSKQPALNGTVCFGKKYRQQLQFETYGIDPDKETEVDTAKVYSGRKIFHGPLLQCLTGKAFYTENYIRGFFKVPSPEVLVKSPASGSMYTEPVILDGLSQLLAVWALNKEQYAFPVSIDAVEVYREIPAPGSLTSVFIKIRENSGKILTSDAEICDPKGLVWLRISGLKMWNFFWSKRYYLSQSNPESNLLSEMLITPKGSRMYCLSRALLKDSDPEHLARFYLSRPEFLEYKKQFNKDKDGHSWLMKKIVAKDAARATEAEKSNNIMSHPALFEISIRENKDTLTVRHKGKKLPYLIKCTLNEDQYFASPDFE